MAKHEIDAYISQITQDGAYHYPNYGTIRGKVIFSSSFDTCSFEGKTFKKIKGGSRGGNYQCIEDGNIYRISQNK